MPLQTVFVPGNAAAVDSGMAPAHVPGAVSATPDRPPARDAYDIAVLGGGLLGAAVAERLRALAPERSLLLVEQGGLPNEDGATVASPGLIPPPASAAVEGDRPDLPLALAWVRSWLTEALGPSRAAADAGRAGWLALVSDGDGDAGAAAAGPPEAPRALGELLPEPAAEVVCALTGVSPDRPAWLLEGGYVSAEALALALAGTAVRAGADLMLNTRALPHGATRIVLERLAADRRMRVGVHARQAVTASVVVVACGAAGAELAEQGLYRPTGLSSAFLQYPRVRLEARLRGRGLPGAPLPAISLAGWAWRPTSEGALLVAPPPPPDPEGFLPVGGRLLGVPVGLRREMLDRLLAAPALAPLLASGRLELGKSVRGVRGARVSVPGDGRPVARRLDDGWWLLAGGSRGLAHDLAAAVRLAADVVGAAAPWG